MGAIHRIKIFDAEAITAGNSATSSGKIDLDKAGVAGNASVYYEITGDGTAKIEVLGSWDGGTTYIDPTDISDIATGLTKTSGQGSDGKDADKIDFNGIVVPLMKIKVTETGGVSAIAITLWICYQ